MTDPIGAAGEVAAQSTLNEAIRIAQVYSAEHGSYEGFGPETASSYDPSIVYTRGTAVPDMVTLSAMPSTVVLVTAIEEGSYLCVAATGDVVTFGRSSATTSEDRQGGWA